MWFRQADQARQETLELARDTITDLRTRLSDAHHDIRHLTALLQQRDAPLTPVVAENPMDGLMLPPEIQDEISLVATNGQMARHLEHWARSELNRDTDLATIIERIRTGDDV